GSFVFIGEMVINLELAYDEPYPSNYCGSCTQCIDACPTGAIVKPGTIDSNRCISYLTIENKSDSISSEFSGKFG
ncbi:MAG TPA: tRNA epoxyqueuosine(34) reductase QueG, partial [Marinilabiliales bacterium]|nr:tRNA epoxyqueuosine(34) reductase QueG [Marinilabiliales bacterium]